MAKAQFINKKALIIILVIILAIGGGVGLYFVFRPRADLSAPYKNFYSLSTNEDYNKMKENTESVIKYVVAVQLAKPTTEEEQKQLEYIQDKYEYLYNIEKNIHGKLDKVFLNNLPFAKDNDGKMLKTQQKMTKSYEEVLKKLDKAKTYFNTYLTDENLRSKNNAQVINLVNNYDTFYFDYFCELCNFYDYEGQIFAKYLEKNFTVNRFSSLVITSTCGWQKQLANSIKSDFDKTKQDLSYNKLINFIDKNFEKFDNYYVSQMDFDNILDCFNIVDFNSSLQAVIDNKYTEFADGLESDEQKEKANILKEKFFFVEE